MQLELFDILSLASAIVLGGLIGLERRVREKPAGLRTNILICLGSCLFTIISLNIAGAEPSRVAAQIVTGIGFLGAGSIIQSGNGVHGLTTAASIWMVAAIGMACGAQMYITAVLATALAMAVLLVLPLFENKI